MLLYRWETLLPFLDLDKSNVSLMTSEVKLFLIYPRIMQIFPSSLIFNDGLRARNTSLNYRETRDQTLYLLDAREKPSQFRLHFFSNERIVTSVVRGTDLLLGALLLCFPLEMR